MYGYICVYEWCIFECMYINVCVCVFVHNSKQMNVCIYLCKSCYFYRIESTCFCFFFFFGGGECKLRNNQVANTFFS